MNSGEPCALKGARTVRRGAVGKVPLRQLANSLPYLQELESLEIPVKLHFIQEEKVTIVRYKIERDLHWIPKTLEAIWDEHHTLKKLEAA